MPTFTPGISGGFGQGDGGFSIGGVDVDPSAVGDFADDVQSDPGGTLKDLGLDVLDAAGGELEDQFVDRPHGDGLPSDATGAGRAPSVNLGFGAPSGEPASTPGGNGGGNTALMIAVYAALALAAAQIFGLIDLT